MDTPTLPLWIVVERSDWTFEIWVDGLTEEEADALSDALCDIACGGQGEGDDHQCRPARG